MTTNERDQINLRSLTDVDPVIAGRKLAPFSAGRLQLCRRAGLKIVAAGAGALAQDELELELLAFYFIHAFPIESVMAACAEGREKLFADHIGPLSFEFPVRELPKVLAFMEREFTGIEAANVAVEPKPSSTSGPTPPPNS